MMLKEESFNYNLKKIKNIQQYQIQNNNILMKMREKKIEEFKLININEGNKNQRMLNQKNIYKKKS